ncbi:hypothetical protein, partial [Klebsiella quasivariicola]|uniref:hypothetical protein n=1 Tax=Klebsiella quasivariicola TaxID=2026240 RepID=UPI001CC2A72C
PPDTRGRSPVRKSRTPGSVRGVSGNGYPYRDISVRGKDQPQFAILLPEIYSFPAAMCLPLLPRSTLFLRASLTRANRFSPPGRLQQREKISESFSQNRILVGKSTKITLLLPGKSLMFSIVDPLTT